MDRLRGAARLLLSIMLLAAVATSAIAASAVAQPAVTFDPPRASGAFGETVTFETTFASTSPPLRVELLVGEPEAAGQDVDIASVEPAGPGRWRATVHVGGHIVPNTPFDYRFRVVTDEGAALGPSALHRVVDERVDWRRLDGERVTVWWSEGDDAFARRALTIAEDALDAAAEMLGVADVGPVDFFVYDDPRQFREAMGPATRENVGGQAHPYIRTLFGLIEPRQISSGWVEELITHELTHLVFDEAADNPYEYPPRWLNEGLAVYLSRGYTRADQGQVEGAAAGGSIIPLAGIGRQFPTRPARIGLAYAESVSAVDHLVRTHGEEALIELITAFGEGLGLDAAFETATGADFAAFDKEWLASLGTEMPTAYGPQPGLPGPLPTAWAEDTSALLR